MYGLQLVFVSNNGFPLKKIQWDCNMQAVPYNKAKWRSTAVYLIARFFPVNSGDPRSDMNVHL